MEKRCSPEAPGRSKCSNGERKVIYVTRKQKEALETVIFSSLSSKFHNRCEAATDRMLINLLVRLL